MINVQVSKDSQRCRTTPSILQLLGLCKGISAEPHHQYCRDLLRRNMQPGPSLITLLLYAWMVICGSLRLPWVTGQPSPSLNSGRGSRERDAFWDSSWDFYLCRNSIHSHEIPTLPGHSSCLERMRSTRPTPLSLWSWKTEIHHWPGPEVIARERIIIDSSPRTRRRQPALGVGPRVAT